MSDLKTDMATVAQQPVVRPIWRRLIVLLFSLLAAYLFFKAYNLISDIVTAVVISVVLTYVIRPLMLALERQYIPRVASILGIFAIITGLLILLITFIVPILVDEIQGLAMNLQQIDISTQLSKLRVWLDSKYSGLSTIIGIDPELWKQEGPTAELLNQLKGYMSNVLETSGNILSGAFNFVALAIVVPFLTFFMLRDGDSFAKRIIEKVPNRYFEMTLSLTHKVDNTMGDYLRGIFIESLIVGGLSWIFFQIMGLKFALVLGVVAGLLNMIQFFGPMLTYIPVLLVTALTYQPVWAGIFWAIVINLSVQALDNIVLKPVVISRSVNVHPVAVLLTVLVGGKLAGALGMFIAVPVYAIAHTVILDLYSHLKAYRVI